MRFLISLIFIGVLATAASSDVTSRNGGPSSSQMLSKGGDGGVDGVAFFRPVLSGVLYRSGFKGGDKERTGLSEGQRETLCGEGFSTGFYADFGKNTEYGRTSCGNGSFDYQSARSSRPGAVMASIHEVIENPGKGPVLVHCMWGVHSSGVLSAMALVQFCGWTEERAKDYWNEARNGAPCSGGCDQWIDSKFSKFSVDPNLTISTEQQAAICPK
ncbi:hypothetical protein RUESEDTHA_03403 [Ruegeria sp. THAF57]|nr:hypothetical protein RUESEDTHA_03403 [Ruegeria sp. THAF57]